MIPFLAEWGLEILFSVISALVLGFFTYQAAQLREKKSQYRELIKEQEAQKAEIALDTKLEPIPSTRITPKPRRLVPGSIPIIIL